MGNIYDLFCFKCRWLLSLDLWRNFNLWCIGNVRRYRIFLIINKAFNKQPLKFLFEENFELKPYTFDFEETYIGVKIHL